MQEGKGKGKEAGLVKEATDEKRWGEVWATDEKRW